MPSDVALVEENSLPQTYQAEYVFTKNKPSTIAEGLFDSSVFPYDPVHKKINILGHQAFHSSGDYVSWEITVEETGLYYRTFKIKQLEGELIQTPVFRTIQIDETTICLLFGARYTHH